MNIIEIIKSNYGSLNTKQKNGADYLIHKKNDICYV